MDGNWILRLWRRGLDGGFLWFDPKARLDVRRTELETLQKKRVSMDIRVKCYLTQVQDAK